LLSTFDQSGNMSTNEPQDSPLAIRSLLARRSLADTRHRGALAQLLGIADNDVLALQHLAREGALTTGRLGAGLRLTSGGSTALAQRLERLGYVERRPHPQDRRSSLLKLTATAERQAGALYAPLVAELDGIAGALPARERRAVAHYLEQVAAATERQAEALDRRVADERPGVAGVPVPGLWA
jgi:DNA-binding MarR family transcriptional regulator